MTGLDVGKDPVHQIFLLIIRQKRGLGSQPGGRGHQWTSVQEPPAALAGLLYSPQKLAIRLVRADPAPSENVAFAVADGPMGPADAHRPNLSDLLRVERGMERIFPKEFVLFVRQALHFGRQFAVKPPEPLGREGFEG